jgi:hypothetical protein
MLRRCITTSARALGLSWLLLFSSAAWSEDLSEYRLKAAFVYNFMVFTEWPPEVGAKLNRCVMGADMGSALDVLVNQKLIGTRAVVVQRISERQSVAGCQVLFVSPSAVAELPRILQSINGKPVLTLADSPGAALEGVAINMELRDSKVGFEVNLKALRSAGLAVSSKLLRLAKVVYQ